MSITDKLVFSLLGSKQNGTTNQSNGSSLMSYRPSVFDAEIEETTNTLNNLDGAKIAFITDTHYRDNMYSKYSISHCKNVVQLSNRTPLDLIIHGGDYSYDYSTKVENVEMIQKVVNAFNGANADVRFLVGNHDLSLYRYWNTEASKRNISDFISDKERTKLLYNKEDTDNKGYFYYDIEDQKIRVICINTNELITENKAPAFNGSEPTSYSDSKDLRFGLTCKQIQWMADSMKCSDKDNPDDWAIILFSHAPFGKFDGFSNSNANVLYTNAIAVGNVIINYMNKKDATINCTTEDTFDEFKGTVTASFASRTKTEFIGCFYGHRHFDRLQKYNNLIWCCGTGCSMIQTIPDDQKAVLLEKYQGYLPDRDYSGKNATEDLWDIININRSTRTVDIVRFGAGDNRQFVY